ncbi:MAG: hypothetical protein PWP49_146 [Thermococcaceae archaeon]|jgi:hypothetical protein|uniref:hypothetical protein n=1 Tax=Thermococcus sp. PK TaxID=913025 RepID=UPI0005B2E7CA|nr:hypothetical protein [Thermococcus sp. PK]MDK2853196.1 hypothetical protein [Thermococcaceae archaeon]MDN5319726.1 hypothetical protein [Thermococcaceae archaeon]HIH73359.1 hypothetical protein [Thermococcaceae archaeon]
MQYKDIKLLNYKNLQDMEYAAALVGKIPYYDFETKKPIFIEKEKVQQVVSELVKEGKFAEAKELVEASKRDYLRELERSLAPKLLSVRISFPLWVKLYALALKYENSPSAVLRRLLINATENLVEDLNKSGVVDPRAYRLIRKSLNNLKELQERKTFDEDEVGRKYMLIYEHEEPIGISDLKHIHYFLKHLVKAYARQENIPEELVDLLFEKNVVSDFETPEAFFYTYIGVFKDDNGIFLRIGPEVNTLDFRYVVFEYPIKAIQEFPAELVLKFHRMILFDAFVNCPSVIEKIRKKLEVGEALTLEDYKSIFCGKFEKEIETLFREGIKPFIYPEEGKEFVHARFLPYCFEDYPLPLFKMDFSERELRMNGIILKKKASKNELNENFERLKNIVKDAYYEAVRLSEEKVMEAKAKVECGEIDENVLEVLSVAKGIDVFLEYLLYRQEGGKDLLSAFSKPSEVFTTTFPKPLVRILELLSGKTIKEILEGLILEEQL